MIVLSRLLKKYALFWLFVMSTSSYAVAGKLFSKKIDISHLLFMMGGKSQEIDSNGDGKIDIRRRFDSTRSMTYLSYDRNFDGKADEWLNDHGSSTTRERDTDYSGDIDQVEVLEWKNNRQDVVSKKYSVNKEQKILLWERTLSGPIYSGGDPIDSSKPFSADSSPVLKAALSKEQENISRLSLQNSSSWGRYENCLGESTAQSAEYGVCRDYSQLGNDERWQLLTDLIRMPCSNNDVSFSSRGFEVDVTSCGDNSTMIADKMDESLEKLLQCFSPGQTSRDDSKVSFANEDLFTAVIDTYLEHISGFGVKLYCTSENASDGKTLASTSFANRPATITLSPDAITPWQIDEVLTHEFMHLSYTLGLDRAIDNQVIEVHNGQGAENVDLDRVYSCTHLCLAQEEKSFINRETCHSCLSYPGVPSQTSINQTCLNFAPEQSIESLRKGLKELNNTPENSDDIQGVVLALQEGNSKISALLQDFEQFKKSFPKDEYNLKRLEVDMAWKLAHHFENYVRYTCLKNNNQIGSELTQELNQRWAQTYKYALDRRINDIGWSTDPGDPSWCKKNLVMKMDLD